MVVDGFGRWVAEAIQVSMRAVCQKVKKASVRVDGEVVGSIGGGWLVLIGFMAEETAVEADWLIGRLLRLKLFGPEEEPQTLAESGGGLLVVSQFTLFANCRKGSKPSWHRAAGPELGKQHYEFFLERLRASTAQPVEAGVFGAMMEVDLCNDGPVTMVLDSKNKDL